MINSIIIPGDNKLYKERFMHNAKMYIYHIFLFLIALNVDTGMSKNFIQTTNPKSVNKYSNIILPSYDP